MENEENSNVAFEVGKNWNNQKMKLRQEYTQLTDADLKFEAGREFEMLTRIGSKLDLKLDEVICMMSKVKEQSITDGIAGKPF